MKKESEGKELVTVEGKYTTAFVTADLEQLARNMLDNEEKQEDKKEESKRKQRRTYIMWDWERVKLIDPKPIGETKQ